VLPNRDIYHDAGIWANMDPFPRAPIGRFTLMLQLKGLRQRIGLPDRHPDPADAADHAAAHETTTLMDEGIVPPDFTSIQAYLVCSHCMDLEAPRQDPNRSWGIVPSNSGICRWTP